jgi:hypothetical protein
MASDSSKTNQGSNPKENCHEELDHYAYHPAPSFKARRRVPRLLRLQLTRYRLIGTEFHLRFRAESQFSNRETDHDENDMQF